jgi:hypothetical protein
VFEVRDLRKVGGIDNEKPREGAYQRGGEHKEPEDHPSHQPSPRHVHGGKF